MSAAVSTPSRKPPALMRVAFAVAVVAAAAVALFAGLDLLNGGRGGSAPLYSFSGLLVGVLVGVTGVGGGSLMTPLLVLLFGFHPSAAVGTDLLYASATKGAGTVVHGVNNTVDWRITGRMALGSVPATAATLVLLYALHLHGDAASRVIGSVLGFALILTALALLFRGRLQALAARHAPALDPKATAALTVALGAALGVLITLSSVGAGAIGVTLLIMLYPKMPVARIVGSDIAHAVPLTLIAGIGHWLLGSVNLSLLGALLVGSIPGIVIGSQFAVRIPERGLRLVLAGTLFLVGGRLAF